MVGVSHHLLTRLSHLVPNGKCDSIGQLKLHAYCQVANMSQWIINVNQVVPNSTCESLVK